MQNQIYIMIVEDDDILSKEIQDFLKRWGYQAVTAHHFNNLLVDYNMFRPHLILMDINLPYFDGFYWCHKIREISHVPIIYISSRSDDKDKIMGIAQGGDDYVEKPFHLDLLKAKIEAIIRRTYQYKTKEKLYINDDVCFDGDSLTLFYKNNELDLTKSEKKIMSLLLEEKSHVLTREELMMSLWNTDEFVSDGTLTTLVCRLRNKLKKVCGDEIICTKKGQGYYIK